MVDWSSGLSQGLKGSVEVEGLSTLLNALRQLPQDLQKKSLAKAITAGAVVIRNAARTLAPVLQIATPTRTAGILRKMITATKGVRRDSEATAFVRVRRLVGKVLAKAKGKSGKSGAELDPFYWGFVEFGNSRTPAHPFMRPAFDTQKEAAVDAIANVLREEIDQASKSAGGSKFF